MVECILRQNSRVTLLKRQIEFVFDHSIILYVILEISDNSAQYGGGMFIEDKTAGGRLCSGSFSLNSEFASTECFIQTINLHSYSFLWEQNLWNIFISNNIATISGDAIYGGLFDRCTQSVSSQAEVKNSPYKPQNGLDYISKTVALNFSVNSLPQRTPKQLCDKGLELVSQPKIINSSNDCFLQQPFIFICFL